MREFLGVFGGMAIFALLFGVILLPFALFAYGHWVWALVTLPFPILLFVLMVQE